MKAEKILSSLPGLGHVATANPAINGWAIIRQNNFAALFDSTFLNNVFENSPEL
jgi:hypothetical protein